MDDTSAKVRSVVVEGITGGHEVFSMVNGNGKHLVELCAECNFVNLEYVVKNEGHAQVYVGE